MTRFGIAARIVAIVFLCGKISMKLRSLVHWLANVKLAGAIVVICAKPSASRTFEQPFEFKPSTEKMGE